MSTSSHLIEVKVVILGMTSSGKSCLLNRYTRDVFYEGRVPSTVGASFFLKKIEFPKFTLGMGIWDTAGSERFESMARMYYRDARAAIVCYDVTCSKSYARAVEWVNELKETSEDCFIYICGTKLDLVHNTEKIHRKIDIHDVIEFADFELFTAVARDLSNTKSVLDLVPSIHLHRIPGEDIHQCQCTLK